MLILTIRTDNPKAEIGLYDDDEKLKYEVWIAHRQLAETLHSKIQGLLKDCGYDWKDIRGIVCFKGPGSFTGLRIGLTVANALADYLPAPIAGTQNGDWIEDGISELMNDENQKTVMPEYGAPVHITLPKS